MPQMMPLNWIMLYFMFLIVFFIFNFMNFYIFTMNMNFDQMKKKNNKTPTWSW